MFFKGFACNCNQIIFITSILSVNNRKADCLGKRFLTIHSKSFDVFDNTGSDDRILSKAGYTQLFRHRSQNYLSIVSLKFY